MNLFLSTDNSKVEKKEKEKDKEKEKPKNGETMETEEQGKGDADRRRSTSATDTNDPIRIKCRELIANALRTGGMYILIYLTLYCTDIPFDASTTQFLKTLWDKEKLLVTSNFSFSHNVFYSIR